MKINNFGGDLTDISAEKEALLVTGVDLPGQGLPSILVSCS